MKTCFIIKLSGMRIAIADVSNMAFGCDLAADKLYEINRINVPSAFRGLGHGTALLKQILAEADAEGATLRLHAHGSGDLSTDELRDWYVRYGFKTDAKGYLVRQPEVTK